MSKLSKLLLTGALAATMFMPAAAHADVNNFVITDFQADETLSRADPQGELHIKERISVDFTDNNHGILRAIPSSYKSQKLQMKINGVSSDTGAPAQYSTYGSNGNTVIKIGDPNRTVTGTQEYTIDYTLHNVISFYNDHDELYWDVNGDQWQQNFQHVAVTLHLPNDLHQNRQPVCFTGAYGSTGQDCTIFSSGDTITAQTTSLLEAGQTLTYVAGFDKGYFRPAAWYQIIGEYSLQIAELLVPILLLGGTSFALWWLRGRDPKYRGVIVPQYDAPDDLRPIEAGAIMDFDVANKDISATIIDLAVRGYIKIIESTEKKKLRPDKTVYSLQLVNSDVSQLKPVERELLTELFPDMSTGTTVDVSALKNKLYKTAEQMRDDTEFSLTTLGYFRSNPLHSGGKVGGLVTTAVLFVWIGGSHLGVWLISGIVIGGIIAFLCYRAMAARTLKGVAAKEQLLGLKMYLEVAEKDRIEKLQSPNAPYASNAGEPVKTVELFEKLLPYAMVLGVEKQWAGKFENIYTEPPQWYAGGNWNTFNAYYLATSLNSGIGSAVNTAFSAPSNSGGSGFGGGFAGGGGGGGGGGGW